MSKTTLSKKKNLEILLDSDTGILYCNWIGFQNKEKIMASGEEILSLLKRHQCTKVLNDNTHVTGPWQDATEWTATVWFPNMIGAGLKHFAWIFSSNIFAELSAKKALPDGDIVKTFNSYTEAERWLKDISVAV